MHPGRRGEHACRRMLWPTAELCINSCTGEARPAAGPCPSGRRRGAPWAARCWRSWRRTRRPARPCWRATACTWMRPSCAAACRAWPRTCTTASWTCPPSWSCAGAGTRARSTAPRRCRSALPWRPPAGGHACALPCVCWSAAFACSCTGSAWSCWPRACPGNLSVWCSCAMQARAMEPRNVNSEHGHVPTSLYERAAGCAHGGGRHPREPGAAAVLPKAHVQAAALMPRAALSTFAVLCSPALPKRLHV